MTVPSGNRISLDEIKKSKHIHFIGIGGVSMSTLAAISASRGHEVSGSDISRSPATERLEKSGIKIFYCHDAANISGADLVVYTWAISDDNPELTAALASGVNCVARCEFLGELMTAYNVRIGVSGTHGKSTTTGMLSQIFVDAGTDPTVECGAELTQLKGAYRLGSGDHFIYEACEYRDSFLSFRPNIAVILNVDMDHLDYFHSLGQLVGSFSRSLTHADAVVYNCDDKNAIEAVRNFNGWCIGFGINNPDGDYQAANIGCERGRYAFDFMRGREKLCRITLSIPGRHDIYDALASAVCAHICGIDPESIASALAAFTGTCRRMQFMGSFGGVDVYDDYAHHPGEVAASLSAAVQMGYERVICVFQPHTYTRARELRDGFAKALAVCDCVVLAKIYAAREKDPGDVSSADIAALVPGALYIPDFGGIADYIRENARPGDLVITMGAGDIYKVAAALISSGRAD